MTLRKPMRLAILALTAALSIASVPAQAIECIDGAIQRAYETGGSDGRSDAERGKGNNPDRHLGRHYFDHEEALCYRQGYRNSYQNASHDIRRDNAVVSDDTGPCLSGKFLDAYERGGRHGRKDAERYKSYSAHRHLKRLSYSGRETRCYKTGYQNAYEAARADIDRDY